MGVGIKYGEKLSSGAAKKVVDALYQKVAARWEERVDRAPFRTRLKDGKPPLKSRQSFFRNWGAYTIEINTLAACPCRRHLTFFKTHRELMAPLGEKIADEFIHPKPPGHFLVMLQTARALGLKEEDVFDRPPVSEFRAKIDFMRGVLSEGTAAEWYGSRKASWATGASTARRYRNCWNRAWRSRGRPTASSTAR